MPDALLFLWLVLGGLVVGSFLNVVIVRVPSKESVVRPPSKCPQCERPIARDNIPVISWLLLKGRCRSCGEPIPAGYPLVEAGNAVLWVLAGLRFGDTIELIPYLALFSVLLALSVIDLELYILPNAITYPAVVVSLVGAVALSYASLDEPGEGILGAAIGGFGYAGFLLVVLLAWEVVVKKEGMGMGDVKLALLLGIWLGYLHPVLVLYSLIMASVVGLVVGGVLLVVRRESRAYPFGPWLAMGAVAAILLSEPILDAALAR